MLPRLLIIILLLGLAADGEDEGRRGNALYEAERYEAAARAYRAGLEARAGQEGTLTARLWNNLGAALHHLERYDEAQEAFARALAAASEPVDLARTAYNTGNNAAARGDLQAALAAYRKALLADPSHEQARFNYEFLKRQQHRRSQKNEQSSEKQKQRPRPSDQQNRSEASKDGQRRPSSETGRNRQGPQQERQQQQAGPPQASASQGDATPRDAGRRRAQELSRAQALRILKALEGQERQLLREVQRGEPQRRSVDKDW